MRTYFWNLWTGEAEFTGQVRGLAFAFITSINTGTIKIPGGVWGSLVVVLLAYLAGSMKAGQPNK